MNRYIKVTAALAAFALLLVVMGLSTQNTVQAQATVAKGIPATPGTVYLCTTTAPGSGCNVARANSAVDNVADANTTFDNVFDVVFAEAGTVVIQNLDLPRVSQRIHYADDNNEDPLYLDGPDANPKTIAMNVAVDATIVAVHKSSGLNDARFPRLAADATDSVGANDGFGYDATGSIFQVKAFNGNRISVSYTSSSSSTFATIKTVVVDNVKPQLVTNSPAIPLIVTDNVDLTFSADITDDGSGYTTKVGTTGDTGAIEDLNDDDGNLIADSNDVTDHGGVRLVVAGNVVELGSGDFEKIDGGWRVSKTINSSAMQNIAANVPWYFETRDRAGNVRRSSGSISGRATTGTSAMLTDNRFTGNLNTGTFLETKIRVTRNDDAKNPVESNSVSVEFAGGIFTFVNTVALPLFDDAKPDILDDPDTQDVQEDQSDAALAVVGYQCPLLPEAEQVAETGAGDAQLADCGVTMGTSYEILGSNLITVDSEEPTLAASAVETGLGYNAATKKDKTQKNSIKLTFGDIGSEDFASAPGSGLDASSVVAGAFSVSGNSVTAVTPVGNKVYLTLSDNLGSTERPSVSVTSGVIRDKAGNAFGGARIAKAEDRLGPNLSLAKNSDLSNDKVRVTIETDEQLNDDPVVLITKTTDRDGAADSATTSESSVRQSGAQAYYVDHSNVGASTEAASFSGQYGGEYSVYVTGADTGDNGSTVGDKASSSSAKAFTFELDTRLNGGSAPIFSVGDTKDVNSDDAGDIEQVDPLIVTVDFSKEGREYYGDSYRTVELTSAKLRVTFDDGSFEDRTFNLTTEISSPDSVKFTIPVLNPKIGSYKLTVKSVDSAGNVRTDSSGTTAQDLIGEWEVVKPSPVDIALAPGWNLVSLPFQPANPAINSVIPADHPADIVMTFDNASQVWMVSRRDAETGLFVGDIAVMTASTAYFIRTENFQAIRMLRPPLATAAAAPPPPPAITVVKGWNLVPVVSNDIPTPDGVAATNYFGTLGDKGWLKALTFDTLVRTWTSVSPGDTVTLNPGDTNPCTGDKLDTEKVTNGNEPCQASAYVDRSDDTDDYRKGDTIPDTSDGAADDATVVADADNHNGDGFDDTFDGKDRVTVNAPVTVGKGYWLYSNVDGVIIP